MAGDNKELAPGQMAPDFTLLNDRNEPVRLKNFRGEKNVLLYFYPKAMTPGCTVQACSVRDSWQDFAKFETVVFGVSADPVKSLQKFVSKKDLNFSLLSDSKKTVSKTYGAISMIGTVARHTFVIGKDGRIKLVMRKVSTKNHHQDVLEFIKENLH